MAGTPSIEAAVSAVFVQQGLRSAVLSWDETGLLAETPWGGSHLILRLLRLPTRPEAPEPFFALARVGEPSGEADAWGIVARRLLSAQAIVGPGWAAIAAPIAPGGAYAPLVMSLLKVLRAVSPRAGTRDREESEWPFAALASRSSASPARSYTIGGSGLAAVSAAAALAAALAPELAPVALPAALYGLPAGLLMLGVGRAARRAFARDLQQGDRVMETLRQSRLIDDLGTPRRARAMPGAVVVPAGPQGRPVAAVHRALIVNARATDCDLEMVLAIHSILWPEHSRADCVLLPGSWVAVEVRGPAEVLARVPSGPRETRSRGVLRWLLGPDDLANDTLSTLLLRAEESLGSAAQGPYR